MFAIPRHDGSRNGMPSTAQRHISHPPTANSACAEEILNPGDHSAGPCTILQQYYRSALVLLAVPLQFALGKHSSLPVIRTLYIHQTQNMCMQQYDILKYIL
jgi:hypothetical protein